MTFNPEYVDWYAVDDLDPFGRDADPLQTFAQDIYHLLLTNKMQLLQDPDWGFGIETYLGRQLPTTLASDIENLIRQDDRASDARCTITKVAQGTVINVGPGNVITADAYTYSLDLRVQVEDTFLNTSLLLTPQGFVRVT